MQVMFVFGLEFALSKSDATVQQGVTRTGHQDDMTFIGSVAAMNRSWNSIEGSLGDACCRLRGYTCGVWAPGFEQFQDQELLVGVRDLCTRSHASDTGSASLGLRQTCNIACMWTLANQLNLPHKRLREIQSLGDTAEHRVVCLRST